MKIDATIRSSLTDVAADVRACEETGLDGAWNTEGGSDCFVSLALACEHSIRIELGPAVAIAFARTPMTIAYAAWDLQRYSGGRFVLGLGSQVRGHVTRRFSMPWSHPAERMREFVVALRRIWTAWESGGPLEHRGRFYEHTLMTPAFSPPPNPYDPPPVFLAAVGPRMVRVAAEVADGLFVHPFCTERYLREVVLPGVAAARPADAPPLQIALSPFVASTEAEVEAVRRKIAFYGSTPAYRGVLELHGRGELQGLLAALAKDGRWDEMARHVDDETVRDMCALGTPTEIAATLRARFGDVASRIRLHRPEEANRPEDLAELVAALREHGAAPVGGRS
ncbi:TIGR03617 family F420-dependent LLM class oxidoreductase [Pseudonocardia xishanensis]|uniref:TIGR03617 family F420-dependent LLM class oxidoreductase n=1 Tax=Pseudonocardia xishanensis TaxID=630995 RepID=A0ABP8REN4_9PSEU